MKQVLFLLFVSILSLQGCNYHYYQGQQLEKQERFEEANIEYHRAFTQTPSDEDFEAAYYRTAIKVADDLMIRYELHLENKKYNLAYELLLKAQGLSPQNEKVIEELYNSKGVYYMNVKGKGLHYIGSNPLGLPVPKLTGDVTVTLRIARTATDKNGNVKPV